VSGRHRADTEHAARIANENEHITPGLLEGQFDTLRYGGDPSLDGDSDLGKRFSKSSSAVRT
jgi:hypothetical protein